MGLAMIRRRGIEEFSVSFLDVICCGFGAIILLLMVTKTLEPIVLEDSNLDLSEQIAAREQAVFEIKGQIEQLRQQIADENAQLQLSLSQQDDVQQQLSDILGRFKTMTEASENISSENMQLASARQSLTDEMEQLLGLDFRRSSELVGGISVDSEYIIFIIDTSGSMQSAAWGQVVQKVSETLSIYPQIKGIQVMNDMGDYMFPVYRQRWIDDTPALRNSIITTLQNWAPFSNSSPVEGIREAIATYYDPDKRISIYVFGDDYTGNSIEQVVGAVDQVNRADETGRRRVRIHAIGFPVYLDQPNARIYRFAALMRELAYRNDGTFVGLTEYQ
jgi:Asp-tRNA(Asn)/Glu-tRNA(Gln) amidotransferase C subunit